MEITEAVIVEGIKKQDRAILAYIYKEYYSLIEQYVMDNNGSFDDAQDVFQESVVILFKDINRGVEINCSVSTYVYAISKRLWLRSLKYKQVRNVVNVDSYEEMLDYSEEHFDKSHAFLVYNRHFKLLSKDCQKVLRLFFLKIPLSEIARQMKYQSTAFAKKKKHNCKERLVNSIKTDAEYEKLKRKLL